MSHKTLSQFLALITVHPITLSRQIVLLLQHWIVHSQMIGDGTMITAGNHSSRGQTATVTNNSI